MAPAAAAMGGGADTGSGLLGIAKKFCLTGTASMAAEVSQQPPHTSRVLGDARMSCFTAANEVCTHARRA